MNLYSIRLYLEPDATGIYTVTSPDVSGLVTEGRMPTEIASNVQEALAGLVEAWRELGRGFPPKAVTGRSSLKNTVLKYEDPTQPVAVQDWGI